LTRSSESGSLPCRRRSTRRRGRPRQERAFGGRRPTRSWHGSRTSTSRSRSTTPTRSSSPSTASSARPCPAPTSSSSAATSAIRFYDHSMTLYKGLEAETGAEIFRRQKGILWIAHSEMGMRTERGRCLMNQALGVRTEMVTPAELKELVPQIDLTGGGRYPAFGASHHVEAATARHDRDAWAFASGATARGVHVVQHRPVTGLLRDGDRVVGVRTAAGDIRAGVVLSAVGGWVTEMAAHAGVRLPIRTHPLHAFVTNDFAQGLDKIVASTELACYVSQTERGQMLIGAEFDSQPSYSRVSSFDALRSYAWKMTRILPFLRDMRILRTWAGLC